MPTQVTAFMADDGSLHSDSCAAARKDIEIMISKSPLAENQPYARKVVEWLTSEPVEIINKLHEFTRACPPPAQDKAARKRHKEPEAQAMGEPANAE